MRVADANGVHAAFQVGGIISVLAVVGALGLFFVRLPKMTSVAAH